MSNNSTPVAMAPPLSRFPGSPRFCRKRGLIALLALSAAGVNAADNWVQSVTASAPKYWYRFEETEPSQPAVSQGSASGWNGAYGPGFTAAQLDQASVTYNLGRAIAFTGPAAGTGTQKYVDLSIDSATPSAGIPELRNLRPATSGSDKSTTVEYWIKTAQSGNGQAWLAPSLLGDESPGDGDIFWGTFTGTGDFGLSTSEIHEILAERDGAIEVTDNNWHHIVLVKEWHFSTVCVSTMYVDGGAAAGGVTVTATTPAGNASYQDTDFAIRYLGFTQSGGSGNLQYIGLFDELVIYDRALTASEVEAHFNSITVDNEGPIATISSPSVPFTGTDPVSFTVTYVDEHPDPNGVTLDSTDIVLNATGTANATSSQRHRNRQRSNGGTFRH